MASDTAFWDSSGLVLLATHQRATTRATAIRRARPRLVVWWGARIEVRSALERLRRTGDLDAGARDAAALRLDALLRAAVEVEPTDAVRSRAERALEAHDLRGADALQLAAALEWARDRARGRSFVCFDDRLARAARVEGFDVRC
jgi:predicted nucleic acid-binding protein